MCGISMWYECDIMTGKKCDRVARWSVKWIHTFRPICTHRTNGWTDVKIVSRPERKAL